MIAPHNQNLHAIASTLAGPAVAASFMAHLPDYVTITAGVLAIIWYTIILTEKVFHWIRKWQKGRSPR